MLHHSKIPSPKPHTSWKEVSWSIKKLADFFSDIVILMMMMMIHRDFLRPARPTALERCETVLCAPAMETFTKTPVRCRESHVDRWAEMQILMRIQN